ncbi:MAG TPA: hypothetical protein VHD56_13175 [Tepidisphaeraceae bacterium]|nr:hypothetical protein [Tepidisphaeraceae bacterium]
MATANVFGKVVHVILTLAEHNGKHELAGWSWLKDKGRKLKIGNLAGVHKINNPPSIHAIASKAIGMPRKDSVRITAFNAIKHVIKHWTPWNFGSLLLRKDFDDGDGMAIRHFVQLSNLIGNAANLPRFIVGGFACIDEESFAFGHADTVARENRGAKRLVIHSPARGRAMRKIKSLVWSFERGYYAGHAAPLYPMRLAQRYCLAGYAGASNV